MKHSPRIFCKEFAFSNLADENKWKPWFQENVLRQKFAEIENWATVFVSIIPQRQRYHDIKYTACNLNYVTAEFSTDICWKKLKSWLSQEQIPREERYALMTG